MLGTSDFVGGFDGTSFLLIGTGLLLSLLVVQIFWAYRNRDRAGSRPRSASSQAEVEAAADADKDMIICPECSKPTEAEYRYCRHCVEDTGKGYVGSGGEGDSNSSGML